MFGYARIQSSRDSIYLRFERVGPARTFDVLLSRFHTTFPLKRWDSGRRARQLPPSDLDILIQFCRMTFGSAGYVVEQETTITI